MEKVWCVLFGFTMAIGVLAQDDEGAEPDKYHLSELLGSISSADQKPLSREFYNKEDVPFPIPLRTAIFEITVNYAEKGFAGDTLYFEYRVPVIPIEILDAVKPEQQIELFLRRSWLDEADYRTIDTEGRSKGYGEHLYYPTRDIAFLDQLPRDRRYDISAYLPEALRETLNKK